MPSSSTPIKVVFLYNSLSNNVFRYLQKQLQAFSIEWIIPEDTSIEKMKSLVSDADILVGWKCPPELLTAAENIKLFITPYTGVSYLVKAMQSLNPPLKCPIVNAHGAAKLIAQHTISLLFGILNHLVIHHNEMIDGKWVPGGEGIEEPFPSMPIEGRKIGLLGYGQINQRVHQMLSGFSVEFHILRKNWKKDGDQSKLPTKIVKYHAEELNEFMNQIDTLIIAAPLTDQTRNMIGKRQLELLGSNGVIVNVGRGKIIDESALFDALNNKIIARAALDVWYIYSPEPDSFGRLWPYSKPFNTLKNVLLSPHRADSPFNDLSRWDDIIENIKKVAKGESDFMNVVDLEEGY